MLKTSKDAGDPLGAARILIVDDEPGMRHFLVNTLRPISRHVDSAEDARAAEAMLATRQYDVMVLDNIMPGQKGLDWLRDQRSKGGFTDTILITAYADLQTAIDAMRAGASDFLVKPFRSNPPAIIAKLTELAEAQRPAETTPTFTSLRRPAEADEDRAAIVHPQQEADAPQASLGLGTPAEALDDPISISDFIKALNFPENEHDKEGFRTLRRALKDPSTKKLIRASQDVLTLLSQDGIYMDDLRPDRAKPEIWRKFAQGDRGKAVAALGGIRDRSSLALSSGRMKQDPVFRDAVHHFLRQFDRTLEEFEQNATDAEIAMMSETRTARAFMLLGRVTGTFD